MSYGGLGQGATRVNAPPPCLQPVQIAAIAGCLADPSKAGCAPLVTPGGMLTPAGKTLAAVPFCFAPAPPGGCNSPEITAGVAYCKQYGWQGPDKTLNALCWGAQHDAAYWHALNALPACDTHEPTTPPPPPPPDDHTKRAMMWGGLLLLVLAAGGYVVYRQTRKKKLRPNRGASARRRRVRREHYYRLARDRGASAREAARYAVHHVPLTATEEHGVTVAGGRR